MATRHRDNGVGTWTLRVSATDSSEQAVDYDPIDSLLQQASRLRLTAPELALVFGERGAALAEAAGAEDHWARAEGLAVAAHVRLGRRASVAGRAVVALRAAEAGGQHDLAGQLRTDLALCARSVGAPWTGLAALRPVLDDEEIAGRCRSAALLQLVGCLGPLGRRDVLDRALVEAEELITSSEGDERDRTLLRASVCGRRAAHLRRHSDIEAAISSARDGLALVEELDWADDGVQLRNRLGLELVCALLDRGDRADAQDVADELLATPGRATSAGPLAWLRLAIATRVLLPAGAAEAAGRSLRSALYDAERHGLCAITSRLWLELSHVEENIGRPDEALQCLHRARKEEHAYGRIRRQALSLLIGEFGRGEQHVLDVPGALGMGRGRPTNEVSRHALTQAREPEGRGTTFGIARHARRAVDADDGEEVALRDDSAADTVSVGAASVADAGSPADHGVPEDAQPGEADSPASEWEPCNAQADRETAPSASPVAADKPVQSWSVGGMSSSSPADADVPYRFGFATPAVTGPANDEKPAADHSGEDAAFHVESAPTTSFEREGTSEIAGQRTLGEREMARDSDTESTSLPSTMDSDSSWNSHSVGWDETAQPPEPSSATANVAGAADSVEIADANSAEDETFQRGQTEASSARSVLQRLGVTVGSGGKRRAPEHPEDESDAAATTPAATAPDSPSADALEWDTASRDRQNFARSGKDIPVPPEGVLAADDGGLAADGGGLAADDAVLAADGGGLAAGDGGLAADGGGLAAGGGAQAAGGGLAAGEGGLAAGEGVLAADDGGLAAGDAGPAADGGGPAAGDGGPATGGHRRADADSALAAVPPRESADGATSTDYQWPDSDENRPAVEMDSVLAVFANWADGGSVDDGSPMTAGARRRRNTGRTNGRKINGDGTVTGRHRGEA